tara:strand:- start:92 stop:298 length:207 start_codon:yes stop_codon:yes gene_type:complete
MVDCKQVVEEKQYYTDFEDLEVNLRDTGHYDFWDLESEVGDYISVVEFVKTLEYSEYLDENKFNFMEV